MPDTHLKQMYVLESAVSLNSSEHARIQQIHNLIPDSWMSLIDIGCGDGRVSNPLVKRGMSVLGVDFAESRLAYCNFETRCGDITQIELAEKSYDGAICSEVLEHLSLEQIKTVVAAIRRLTRRGFIISVPAYEHLTLHTVTCPDSQETYHVWGHLHSFHSPHHLDRMIEQKASECVFVPYQGIRESLWLNKMRRKWGWYPYEPHAVAPVSGVTLRPFSERDLPQMRRIGLKLTSKLEALTSFLRPPTGWFICRYLSE